MRLLSRAAIAVALVVSALTSAPVAYAQSNAARASDPSEVLGSTYHPFSACHLAIAAGMSYGRLGTSANTTGFDSGTGTGTLPLAADGAIASLGGGCDMHFNRIVVGGFANYTLGNVGTRIADVTLDVNNQYAFGGRLGFMMRPDTMIYTKLGYVGGQTDIKWTDGGETKHMNGVQLGLGTEYKIAAPVWLRLEMVATRYEKITVQEAVDINPTIYSATAAVVFKF